MTGSYEITIVPWFGFYVNSHTEWFASDNCRDGMSTLSREPLVHPECTGHIGDANQSLTASLEVTCMRSKCRNLRLLGIFHAMRCARLTMA